MHITQCSLKLPSKIHRPLDGISPNLEIQDRNTKHAEFVFKYTCEQLKRFISLNNFNHLLPCKAQQSDDRNINLFKLYYRENY